jgi:hypothetical protein
MKITPAESVITLDTEHKLKFEYREDLDIHEAYVILNALSARNVSEIERARDGQDIQEIFDEPRQYIDRGTELFAGNGIFGVITQLRKDVKAGTVDDKLQKSVETTVTRPQAEIFRDSLKHFAARIVLGVAPMFRDINSDNNDLNRTLQAVVAAEMYMDLEELYGASQVITPKNVPARRPGFRVPQ